MSAIATDRFAVKALPQELATYVREKGRDPKWGHPVLTQPATGFGSMPALPAHVQGGRGDAHAVHARQLRRCRRVPPAWSGLHPRRRLRSLRGRRIATRPAGAQADLRGRGCRATSGGAGAHGRRRRRERDRAPARSARC